MRARSVFARLSKGCSEATRRSPLKRLELLAAHGTPSSSSFSRACRNASTTRGSYNLAAATLARVAGEAQHARRGPRRLARPDRGLLPRADATRTEHGSRVFDYGPRSFRLRISSELRVELVTEDGSVLLSLPAPRETDDLAKVDASRRAFEPLRAELEKTLSVQATRLEHALSSGRLWDAAAWKKHLLRDRPRARRAAARLGGVRRQRSPEHGLHRGRVRRPHGRPPREGADASRVDRARASRRARRRRTRRWWSTVLNDFRIVQPFLQLGPTGSRCSPERPRR